MRADVCSKVSAPASLDPRYVFGVTCTWHGPIQDAAYCFPPGSSMPLPCCPHCGGMLMEVESEEAWKANVHSHGRNHPDYVAMLAWAKGRCYPDVDTLPNAYRQAMEE